VNKSLEKKIQQIKDSEKELSVYTVALWDYGQHRVVAKVPIKAINASTALGAAKRLFKGVSDVNVETADIIEVRHPKGSELSQI